MDNKKISKLWTIGALCMFVSATFQIASGHFILGAIFFGSASCFSYLAAFYSKREKEEDND